jgi:hypothetical protein
VAAIAAALGVVLVATGNLPVNIGEHTAIGGEGALAGTVGIMVGFLAVVLALAIVIAVVYGLGFLLVALAIFIPVVIIVGISPVLAPVILVGLLIWWLLRRANRKPLPPGVSQAP